MLVYIFGCTPVEQVLAMILKRFPWPININIVNTLYFLKAFYLFNFFYEKYTSVPVFFDNFERPRYEWVWLDHPLQHKRNSICI